MTWTPLSQRVDKLPLILAGPILRKVEPNSVTVWLALRESRMVTLAVLDTNKKVLITGKKKTIRLGDKLHIVAVTARSDNNLLLYGENYLYNLAFNTGETLITPGVLNHSGEISDIAYSPYDLPSFALVPSDINNLRLIHGSCRKPHGESLDALATVDKMIKEALIKNPKQRPHQLFLTGDQIYADDVADALLFMLMDAASELLGWSEVLPDVKNSQELNPGKRNNLATHTAGLTASLDKFNQINNIAKSHLFTFGEFMMMYIFAWSDVLWCHPVDFPSFIDINKEHQSKQETEYFDKKITYLKNFYSSLKDIRRALANVPTYMIFDDHEVTDDFYLNIAWCERVLNKPLGRRILQNGLLGYALCQAWGNTPEQFLPGQAGFELLKAVEIWSASKSLDLESEKEISFRLALPNLADIKNSQPKGLINYNIHNNNVLKWHYYLNFHNYEVIVLDTRTWREFPGQEFDFPALLGELGCDEQISKVTRPHDVKVTLIVSPAPFIGVPFVETIQKAAKSFSKKLGFAAWGFDPEAWGLQKSSYERFIAKLALRALPAKQSCAVILSGDVHYSFSARLQYSAIRPFGINENINTELILVQFTSSSLKNEVKGKGGSHSLHTKGFVPFDSVSDLPTSEILGWSNPENKEITIGTINTCINELFLTQPWKLKANPAKIDLAKERSLFKVLEITEQPDWCYRTDFLLAKAEEINITKFPSHIHPEPITAPLSPNERKSALAKYLAMAKNSHEFLNQRGAGKEIVGVNNIGEINFNFTDNKITANQTLWWRLKSWEKGILLDPFPLTITEASLVFNDKEYPMEQLLIKNRE